ncbi:hypothetical protein [Niallia sp. 03133]|uniref:hypothetical protein n=1 Tax=Niallia sp. 03133 TaxID=3458060 RepID=UPI004044F54D
MHRIIFIIFTLLPFYLVNIFGRKPPNYLIDSAEGNKSAMVVNDKVNQEVEENKQIIDFIQTAIELV